MHASEIVLVSLVWTLGSPWGPANECRITCVISTCKAYYTYIGMYKHAYAICVTWTPGGILDPRQCVSFLFSEGPY